MEAVQPFQSVLTGEKKAMESFTLKDIEAIVLATHTGMTVEAFQEIVRDWMATAKHPRFNKLYAMMAYQPMLDVMRYPRANGYKKYVVTGGGQVFVRAYVQHVYGVPPEQIIGSALETQYTYRDGQASYCANGRFCWTMTCRQARGHLPLHRQATERRVWQLDGRPADARIYALRQRSTIHLVLHDDTQREYSYGPAEGLPNTKVGTFPQSLYDEAKIKVGPSSA
jgi:haloacid dehalogenase-like hydrolase